MASADGTSCYYSRVCIIVNGVYVSGCAGVVVDMENAVQRLVLDVLGLSKLGYDFEVCTRAAGKKCLRMGIWPFNYCIG